MFELRPLPYELEALEPHISAATLEVHHNKHHAKYVETLNALIKDTLMESRSLEEIIRASHDKPETAAIFNNAGQVWNHDFFWASMKPNSDPPTLAVEEWLTRDFGGVDQFKEAFKNAALGQFGSGWVWLTLGLHGSMHVLSTSNAESPLVDGQTPLLTCDVWEHAYYLDYQNRRGDFVQAFLDHLVNWDLVANTLQGRTADTASPRAALKAG